MKISKKIGIVACVVLTTLACNKEECHECHYDKDGGEVELGEKCGDELESLEASGYNKDGVNYEVHCHEH